MKADELLHKYFEFFEKNNHNRISGSSLIPENDPTVLFTTAGMHPLVPYLLGQPHPQGKRIVNIQKCIRTGDIDEVGDNVHHTFFQMLGYWSLGDYFKEEALKLTYELVTKVFLFDKDKLAVTCFGGDENYPDLPKDFESYNIWKNIGFSDDRIAFLKGGVENSSNNWWGPAGKIGPCGPDSEIFYWADESDVPKNFDPDDKRWVEIGNDVFMQYNKTKDSKFVELSQKNVDFGMGFERVLAISNNFDDNYQTELFNPIVNKIEELSNKSYDDSINIKKAMRIIADHLRSATFVIGDDKGVVPSKEDQGYVVRRLIRRSIRYCKNLDIPENSCKDIVSVIIDLYSKNYPELLKNKEFVLNEIKKEEEKFNQTLEKGLKEFEKIINTNNDSSLISGKDAFLLYQSYGFPIELTKELAKEHDLSVDENGFYEEFKKHQELSRLGAEKKFKSGLMDHSVMSTKYHTATHLLHAALRKVLGGGVFQKGSNITQDRLRFDFSYPEKLTPEQKNEIENLINKWISEGHVVKKEEMTLEKAKESGAIGLFDAKYDDIVFVYTIDNISKEICSGPHVENISKLGHFKIKKEQSVSAGVRRIKAILE